MPEKRPDTQVGQYYLMEKIAQGGMAEIYKGLSYDVHGLKKTVCIKKILPQLAASEEFIGSLIDEAKLAVKLVHGNIAQTFDLGKVGDDYFMVMEFVDGRSLSQINKKCLAKGELIPLPFLIYFISEVLNGLGYMHRRAGEAGEPLHIVHRDISPQNIMVSYSGTVKIIDFGIAKAAYKFGSTDSGMLKGKFAYMSPEQALGDEIDKRSDIFSLGIIFHEMLTGKRLFKADDSRQTIRNVRGAKVAPPSTIRGDLPEELDRISLKALSKDRRHRYPSAADMHGDLMKFLHAHYPDFKMSDAAAFLLDLFGDDIKNRPPMEADAKTPHLIIDRSNSALADDSQFETTGRAHAPLNLKEYMLEDETSPPHEGEEDAGIHDEEGIPSSPSLALSEYEEMTSPKWGISRFAVWKGALIKGIAIGAIVLASITLIRHLLKEPSQLPAGATSSTAGQIMVVTIPPDATVSLDGKAEGQGSPMTIRNIPAGEKHVLGVARDGYIPHEQRLKLSPGEFASISVTLVASSKPTAAVEISTTPPGATVFLDDHETAYRTPATVTGLSTAGKHTFGLYLSGYRFWSKGMTLKAGETRSLDVGLVKDFGSLLIDSTPSRALVMIDGVPVGQTPLTREDLEPEKVYRVEVWQEGYSTYSQEIKTEAGRRQEIRATLTPEPKTSPPAEAKKPKEETKATDSAPQKPGGLIETPAPINNPR
ncbi:MAG: serine/threonine-protein kinase [Pseudomonadota bacterium]